MIAHGRRGRWYGFTADEAADALSTDRIRVDAPVVATYDDRHVDGRGTPFDCFNSGAGCGRGAAVGRSSTEAGLGRLILSRPPSEA